MGFYIVNILCILVTIGVHEYGHFFFSKRYGVIAQNFSICFGPEIFGFNNDGTRFSLRLIPLGGYVQLEDEDIESLTSWEKIKVFLAGPIANLFLCIVVGMILIYMGMIPEQLKDVSWFVLVLMNIVCTPILFLLAVPFTIYLIFHIFLHPVVSMAGVAGPVGIFSGKAIPLELFDGLGYIGQAVLTIWLLSFAIGTFNLVPLSILDGGRIFKELFHKYLGIIKVWEWSSNTVFVVLFIYLIGTDIIKMF